MIRKRGKMEKEAQSAIEFVILIGFILLFFTMFFLAIQENMSDKIREKQNLALKEVVLTVQDEINLAFKSSDGYSRKFKLPEKIGNQDYDINIIEGMVYVRTKNEKYAMALPIVTVEGEINKGSNDILKEKGMVYLNVLPICLYGGWISYGCGFGNCKSSEIYQNRTLNATLTECLGTSRCIYDEYCGILEESAVSYWKFDIDARDEKGINNGTLKGNAYIGTSGDYIAALVLDGSGDYVNVSHTSSLEPEDELTYAMWIYRKENYTYQIILQKDDENIASYFYKRFIVGWGTLRFYAYNGSTMVYDSGFLIGNEQWYHVAISVNEDEYVKMYVNGIEVYSNTSAIGNLLRADNKPLTIGAKLINSDPVWFFNGAIDEVMFFNKSLTSSQINAIYNAQKK